MKKLIKNKFIFLIICVTIVSLLYFLVQKAIDNYVFEMDNEIDFEEESIDSGDVVERDEIYQEEEKDAVEGGDGQILDEETDLILEEEGNPEGVEAEEISENQNKIYVYVTGEVNCPGVVLLNEGSRIVDAINAAGGTTTNANVSKVNLVYVLEDGMKLNIPNDNDLKNNSNFEYITMNSGDGGNNDYYASGSSEGSSSNTNSENYSSGNRGGGKKYSVVNINTATQTELETLPGIGPSLALKIITYRKEIGRFSSIDQIKEVSGIGESKFESLKDYITY